VRRCDALDAMEALVRRLPASADLIRQRFWRDMEFRSVCEDYRDASEALARLEADPGGNADRIAEYRQVAAELLAEAGAMLKGGQP
jgi:hypothetical protein